MLNWESLRVLVLGGAGQCGIEICRQLCSRDVEAIFVHDLELERAEAALGAIRAGIDPRTELVASAGDVFDPATVTTWPAQSTWT